MKRYFSEWFVGRRNADCLHLQKSRKKRLLSATEAIAAKINIQSKKVCSLAVVSLLMIVVSVNAGHSCEEADRYWRQADELKKHGEFERAAQAYLKSAAEEQACETVRYDRLSLGYIGAGALFQSLKQYEKAISTMLLAIEALGNTSRRDAIAYLEVKIAIIYNHTNQYQKALAHYQKALEILTELGDENQIATVKNAIGILYDLFGKYGAAKKYYQEALDIHRAKGNLRGVAIVLSNLGKIHSSVAQYEEAIVKLKEALDYFETHDKLEEVAKISNNISAVYNFVGAHDAALKYSRKALEVARKNGDKKAVCLSLKHLADTYENLGKYEKALEYLKESFAIAKQLNSKMLIGSLQDDIGSLYRSWGYYDLALENFQEALRIHRSLKLDGAVSPTLSNIGIVYYYWGDYKRALEYFQQALDIDKKAKRNHWVANHLNKIGVVHSAEGRKGLATENFKKSFDIYIDLGLAHGATSPLNNLVSVYSRQGYYDEAISVLELILKIATDMGLQDNVSVYQNNIGELYYKKGEYQKAEGYFLTAVASAKEISDKAKTAKALSNVGSIYQVQKENDKAIKYYLEAISLKEDLRKTASGDTRRDYLASQLDTYQLLTYAYLTDNNPQGVLKTVEQSRAKLLSERVAGITADISAPTIKEVQQSLTHEEVVLLYGQHMDDIFYVMVISSSDVTMLEIKNDQYLNRLKSLYKKPLLLKMKNRQRGFVKKTNKAEKALSLPQQDEESGFDRAVNYFRMSLVESAVTNERGIQLEPKNKEQITHHRLLGRVLYDLLVAPVASLIKAKKRLVIVPDGIMAYLPFETLIDSENRYIAESFEVKYTQSLTVLRMLNTRKYRQDRKPMLALGGAVYEPISEAIPIITNRQEFSNLKKEVDGSIGRQDDHRIFYQQLGLSEWQSLPGTLSEVQELSKITEGTEILIGEMASEGRLKELSESGELAKFKSLHFATHGLVVPSFPQLSALVLSQFNRDDSNEDGYLRMAEVSKLDIKADFVNLSACETGLGRIYDGEGVVGLTQSFLIAGANGMAASLWQVADASTARFMQELYTYQKETNGSYSEAISEVKKKFIHGHYGQKWKSPYFWAPFVYYGR